MYVILLSAVAPGAKQYAILLLCMNFGQPQVSTAKFVVLCSTVQVLLAKVQLLSLSFQYLPDYRTV